MALLTSGMDFLEEKDVERLKEWIKGYEDGEFRTFFKELGYEDWMNMFVDTTDKEDPDDREWKLIEDTLKEIWNEVKEY